VSAPSTVSGAQEISDLTVIIEVKGCWNIGVRTALKSQLVEDYLQKNGWTHGIYVVGWFVCDRWKQQESNLNSARFEDTAKEMDDLATLYDGVKSAFRVKAVCLDCRFPSGVMPATTHPSPDYQI
jgi:hypothetical protein